MPFIKTNYLVLVYEEVYIITKKLKNKKKFATEFSEVLIFLLSAGGFGDRR